MSIAKEQGSIFGFELKMNDNIILNREQNIIFASDEYYEEKLRNNDLDDEARNILSKSKEHRDNIIKDLFTTAKDLQNKKQELIEKLGDIKCKLAKLESMHSSNDCKFTYIVESTKEYQYISDQAKETDNYKIEDMGIYRIVMEKGVSLIKDAAILVEEQKQVKQLIQSLMREKEQLNKELETVSCNTIKNKMLCDNVWYSARSIDQLFKVKMLVVKLMNE